MTNIPDDPWFHMSAPEGMQTRRSTTKKGLVEHHAPPIVADKKTGVVWLRPTDRASTLLLIDEIGGVEFNFVRVNGSVNDYFEVNFILKSGNVSKLVVHQGLVEIKRFILDLLTP